MANQIADWDELYPGRFFKAGLLQPAERRVLTVAGVQLEELEGDKGLKQKGVLSFKEDTLQLPLNKTNGICLREMFGRVPYKWVGHQFAIFASEWAGEPCIRIWGSPELERDLEVLVQLPRKKPFKMVMHAMGVKLAPVPSADKSPIGERCMELMKLMGLSSNADELTGIEAELAMETFTEHEGRVLAKALAKRRTQLG